jgi:hypothetical protein
MTRPLMEWRVLPVGDGFFMIPQFFARVLAKVENGDQ